MVRRQVFRVAAVAVMWASATAAPVVWAQQPFEAERFAGTALEPFVHAAQRIHRIRDVSPPSSGISPMSRIRIF